MRLVRPLRPFFAGSHTYSPGGEPVELDDRLAAQLVKSGLAEYVAAIPPAIQQTVNPAPARAEQAVAPRQAKQERR